MALSQMCIRSQRLLRRVTPTLTTLMSTQSERRWWRKLDAGSLRSSQALEHHIERKVLLLLLMMMLLVVLMVHMKHKFHQTFEFSSEKFRQSNETLPCSSMNLILVPLSWAVVPVVAVVKVAVVVVVVFKAPRCWLIWTMQKLPNVLDEVVDGYGSARSP